MRKTLENVRISAARKKKGVTAVGLGENMQIAPVVDVPPMQTETVETEVLGIGRVSCCEGPMWAIPCQQFHDAETGWTFHFANGPEGQPVLVVEVGRNSGNWRTFPIVDGIIQEAV